LPNTAYETLQGINQILPGPVQSQLVNAIDPILKLIQNVNPDKAEYLRQKYTPTFEEAYHKTELPQPKGTFQEIVQKGGRMIPEAYAMGGSKAIGGAKGLLGMFGAATGMEAAEKYNLPGWAGAGTALAGDLAARKFSGLRNATYRMFSNPSDYLANSFLFRSRPSEKLNAGLAAMQRQGITPPISAVTTNDAARYMEKLVSLHPLTSEHFNEFMGKISDDMLNLWEKALDEGITTRGMKGFEQLGPKYSTAQEAHQY